MKDTRCPYCGKWQEINHDDGYGYDENILYQQECSNCNKIFTFHTTIIFDYSAYTADCLNGGEHKYKKTYTRPKKFTKMRCIYCEDERDPTDAEWKNI